MVDKTELETKILAKILPTRRAFLSMQPIRRNISKQPWSTVIEVNGRNDSKQAWSTVIEVKEEEAGIERDNNVNWSDYRFGHGTHSNKSSSSDDYNQFYE